MASQGTDNRGYLASSLEVLAGFKYIVRAELDLIEARLAELPPIPPVSGYDPTQARQGDDVVEALVTAAAETEAALYGDHHDVTNPSATDPSAVLPAWPLDCYATAQGAGLRRTNAEDPSLLSPGPQAVKAAIDASQTAQDACDAADKTTAWGRTQATSALGGGLMSERKVLEARKRAILAARGLVQGWVTALTERLAAEELLPWGARGKGLA
jgi:hypothetical protein